jgi:hypothetical protein
VGNVAIIGYGVVSKLVSGVEVSNLPRVSTPWGIALDRAVV